MLTYTKNKLILDISGLFVCLTTTQSYVVFVSIYTRHELDYAVHIFTITAEIHARSLANFYCQYADRHMNLKFMRRVSERAWRERESAIASWIHSCFDNVMTKFMINNRTDA